MMKMFKVYGVRNNTHLKDTMEDINRWERTFIYIAGASETDIRYQIKKYGLIAINKIEEVYCYA